MNFCIASFAYDQQQFQVSTYAILVYNFDNWIYRSRNYLSRFGWDKWEFAMYKIRSFLDDRHGHVEPWWQQPTRTRAEVIVVLCKI